jgi:hypothetical protein
VGLSKNPYLRVLALQLRENFSGAVARAVVDAEQLEVERNRQNPLHYSAKGRALIVDRHYD